MSNSNFALPKGDFRRVPGLRRGWVIALAMAVVWSAMGITNDCLAVVVVHDTFDDADRDNDGFTDDGNNTAVESNDGISWYGIDGISFTTATQKPVFMVMDDSGANGIDSGNALHIAPIGSYNEWIGVFDETITLGSNFGDQLVVSYDIRILDAALTPFPGSSFRFGIYQDSDNEFGMSSFNSDPAMSPTIWGETDGWFDKGTSGNGVGTLGDYGVNARIHLGSGAPDDSSFRVYEELNIDGVLGGNGTEGGDIDYVAKPDGLNGNPDFGDMNGLNDDTPHHITLTLERVAANGSGQDVRMSVDVDGTSFGGQDSNGTGAVDVTTRDSFDYFVALETAGLGGYLMDNFKVELIEGVGLAGDFNNDLVVDAADYTVWRDGLGTTYVASDYDVWVANYGTSIAAATTVPEPSTLLSLLTVMAFSATTRRKHC